MGNRGVRKRLTVSKIEHRAEADFRYEETPNGHGSGPPPGLIGSAVLAVEQVAHGSAAGFIRLTLRLAIEGVGEAFTGGRGGFGSTAFRTAIGETGFIRFELKLFRADGTDSDRKRHKEYFTGKPGVGVSA